MQTDLVQGIEKAYSERTDQLVLTLTGRTGSGCTTAANSLPQAIGEIALSEEDFVQPERRKMTIDFEYAQANWIPFTAITVSTVIYSFLLDERLDEIDAFLVKRTIAKKGRDELNEHLSSLSMEPSSYAFKKAMRQECSNAEKAAAWQFFERSLCPLALQTRRVLAAQYPPLFQALGDNIRFSGTVLDSAIRPDRLFALMDRVRQLIDCVAAYRVTTAQEKVRVVVDAIRSPLELVYLRKHTAGLYVVAITAENGQRRA